MAFYKRDNIFASDSFKLITFKRGFSNELLEKMSSKVVVHYILFFEYNGTS